MTHSNDDPRHGVQQELSDEEQRTIVLDEMSGCWQRSIDRGAGPDTLAATAIATAFTQIVDSYEIGRAQVLTPVTNEHIVCRLMLEQKNEKQVTKHISEKGQ